LHFDDVRKLLEVLHRLADLGNTVIIIEHNLDVIRNADWIIDLGPEGGEDGGRLVAEGRPVKVAATPESYTGQFLKRYYSSNNGHLESLAGEEDAAKLAIVSGAAFPCANGSDPGGTTGDSVSVPKKRARSSSANGNGTGAKKSAPRTRPVRP
jgi:excinuclease ABC subunit A